MIGRLIATLVVNVVAIWVAAAIFDGIRYDDLATLAVTGVVLGIVNLLVRPIVTLLTLPFVVITLGLWLIVVNAIMLMLTSWLVDGFSVDGFWTALWAAIVIGLVNWILGTMLRADGNKKRRAAQTG